MIAGSYLDGLTLAECLYRKDPDLARGIYSEAVFTFLRDGLVVLPGVIDTNALDQLDQDINRLAHAKSNPLLSWVEIDGPKDYYKARYLVNLKTDDFRTLPPGLKLVNLQRFFKSAEALSFADPVMGFLEEAVRLLPRPGCHHHFLEGKPATPASGLHLRSSPAPPG